MLGIVRIDPQIVVVAVSSAANVRQRLPAVGRSKRTGVENVDGLFVHRVGGHVRVVERPLTDAAVFIRQLPGLPRIIRDKQPPARVLDQGVHAIRVSSGYGDADPSHHSRRQSRVASDFSPGLTAVYGFEESTARTAAGHLILDAVRLPERCVHDVGIPPVDSDVGRARPVVAKQCALPGFSAVRALVHTTLLAWCAVLPKARDKHDVGIGWMNAHARDRVGVRESHVRPGLACVARFVDAVARHDVAANARFTHADEDDVRIRVGHGHGPNRGAFDVPIGHRQPVLAAVNRLPQAAANGAEVRFAWTALHTRDRNRSSPAKWSDTPPTHIVRKGTERLFLSGRPQLRAGAKCQQRGSKHQGGDKGSTEAGNHRLLLKKPIL
jgi:hypothetical protein